MSPGSGSTTLFMIGIGAVLVLLVVILVFLSNPPNKWVEKISREKRDDSTRD